MSGSPHGSGRHWDAARRPPLLLRRLAACGKTHAAFDGRSTPHRETWAARLCLPAAQPLGPALFGEKL